MSQFNISPEEVSKLEEKFEIKSNERKLKNFFKIIDVYCISYNVNLPFLCFRIWNN